MYKPTRKATIIAAVVILGIAVVASLAVARQDPLRQINRQSYPPNVLFLLDVSEDMAKTTDGNTYLGGDNPASRMYIMKDTVRRILREVGGVANWGFMTFYQRHKINDEPTLSYYPYYRSAGTGSTPTEVEFEYNWLLSRWHYSVSSGPENSFYMNGVTYTIIAAGGTGDSRYRRSWTDSSDVYHIKHIRKDYVTSECYMDPEENIPYCVFADPDDSLTYTWLYESSYYTYPRQNEDTVTGTFNFGTFNGPQFVDFSGGVGGVANATYVYATEAQLSADANNCTSPTILCNIDATPEADETSCVLTDTDFQAGPAKDYAKGILLERISTSLDPNVQAGRVENILERMRPSYLGGVIPRGSHRPAGHALANCVQDDPPTPTRIGRHYIAKTVSGIGTPPPSGPVSDGGYSNWFLESINNSKYYCSTGTECAGLASRYQDQNYGYGGCSGDQFCKSKCSTTDSGNKCALQTWVYQGAYYYREESAGTNVAYNDAYHYFYEEIIPNDPNSLNQCRRNYIIMLGGGNPDSPHDPQAMLTAGTRLKEMRVTVGGHSYPTPVTTYVLTWSGLAAGAEAKLNELAANSGSGHAYLAGSEAEFEAMLRNIIYEIAKGDYATAPPAYAYATSTGSSTAVPITLLSTAKFPEWQGHLYAVNANNQIQIWDAGEMLAARAWNTRKVYTSNPQTNELIYFDPSQITSLATTLMDTSIWGTDGVIASSTDEAEGVIEFILGKDRDWKLGDLINSGPAVLIPPPWYKYPPANDYPAFAQVYSQRKKVVFDAGNDGMLHAFAFAQIKDISGTVINNAGDELWAYIPPDLISRLKELYMNHGQKAAPKDHLYYIANSPKLSDVRFAAGWGTALTIGEGPGGYHYIMLDITHPSPGDIGYSSTEPFKVLWTTFDPANTTDPNHHKSGFEGLGETWSSPVFGNVEVMDVSGTAVRKDVVAFGSGYDDISPGNVSHGGIGTTIYVVDLESGDLIKSLDVGNAPSGAIAEAALLSDPVAFGYSRFNYSGESGFQARSDFYLADMGGRIWKVDSASNTDPTLWTAASVYPSSTDPTQPFYYAFAMAPIQESSTSSIRVLAGASGSSEDKDLDATGVSFTTKIYLLYEHGGTVSDFTGYPKSIEDFEMEPGVNFPAGTRVANSPIIAYNPANDFFQVAYSLYVPSDVSVNPCGIGSGYIMIIKVPNITSGASSAVPEEQHVAQVTEGKPSGMSFVGGTIIVGESGHGEGKGSVKSLTTVTPAFYYPKMKMLYWKEKM